MVLVVLVVVVADPFRARGGGPTRSVVVSTVAWFGPKPRATRTRVGNARAAESKGLPLKPEIVEERSARDKTR
jgi:hypothetical protein